MVSKTAFVTCTEFPKLTEDDLLAAKALGKKAPSSFASALTELLAIRQ